MIVGIFVVRIPVVATILLVKDGEEKIIGASTVARDVSKRKLAGEERQKLLKRLCEVSNPSQTAFRPVV